MESLSKVFFKWKILRFEENLLIALRLRSLIRLFKTLIR